MVTFELAGLVLGTVVLEAFEEAFEEALVVFEVLAGLVELVELIELIELAAV